MFLPSGKSKGNDKRTCTQQMCVPSASEKTNPVAEQRVEIIAQRKLQLLAQESPRAKQLKGLQEIAQNSAGVKQLKAFQELAGQRVSENRNATSHIGSIIQRRKLMPAELGPGVAEEGIAPIFESPRISTGPVYSKTIATTDNDVATVIASYQAQIAPIGKAARALTNIANPNPAGTKQADAYTDKNIASPFGAMGATVTPAFRNTLSTALVSSLPQLAALGFTNGLAAAIAGPRIQNLFGDRNTMKDNANIGLIDPFILRLTFTPANKIKGESSWVLDTQFASTAAGYIIRIQDGKNNVTAGIVTPGEFASKKDDESASSGPDKGNDMIYSSTHEQGSAKFGDRIGKLDALAETTDNRKSTKDKAKKDTNTRGKHAEGFDAITWLAAEGARFKPVAEFGNDATPETNFFTSDPDGPGWRNVTLNWLMSNWGGSFARGYGISKEHIARVIGTAGTHVTTKPAKPSYDLESGKITK